MAKVTKPALAWLLLLVPACGGSSELTCELLEDPGNCWAQAAAAAADCLPGGASGVLSVDRASCSYPDGTLILFVDPLPYDNMDLERFGFSIETDGSTCASFIDTFENRMELEAGGHSAVAELRAGKFKLSCGNGKSYQADFDLLFECAPGSGPTDGFEVSADQVFFSIVSVATPGELFRCTF